MSDNSYIEVGILNSWAFWPDNKLAQPTNVYAFFWGDTDTTGKNQFIHTIRNTVPDGTDHTFSIQRTAPKTWAVIVDGHIEATSGIVHAAAARSQDVGIEFAGPDPTTCSARADRFDMYPRVYSPAGGWSEWATYTVPGGISPTMHGEGHLTDRPTHFIFWKDGR